MLRLIQLKLIYGPKKLNDPDSINYEWSRKEYLTSKISYFFAKLFKDIDPKMIPYICKMNNIPGVYTMFTCEGHYNSKGELTDFGYLYFRAQNKERAYEALQDVEEMYPDFCSVDEGPKLTIRFHPKAIHIILPNVIKKLQSTILVQQ
jgi:hypothetical protein